jgi:hypothetical protein
MRLIELINTDKCINEMRFSLMVAEGNVQMNADKIGIKLIR